MLFGFPLLVVGVEGGIWREKWSDGDGDATSGRGLGVRDLVDEFVQLKCQGQRGQEESGVGAEEEAGWSASFQQRGGQPVLDGSCVRAF